MQTVFGLCKFIPGAVEYEFLWASITQQTWKNNTREYGARKKVYVFAEVLHK